MAYTEELKLLPGDYLIEVSPSAFEPDAYFAGVFGPVVIEPGPVQVAVTIRAGESVRRSIRTEARGGLDMRLVMGEQDETINIYQCSSGRLVASQPAAASRSFHDTLPAGALRVGVLRSDRGPIRMSIWLPVHEVARYTLGPGAILNRREVDPKPRSFWGGKSEVLTCGGGALGT